MLNIASVTIRNFLSYGDYDTTLSFKGLGTTLITGEVADREAVNQSDINNGAGKSNIISAIQWCLFGRTAHTHNPGDKVINWFTKKDCRVEIKFENGDNLVRTRNVGGHNDLLFTQDGEDVSLGTTGMQQESLNKTLGLDWDIFCGSTFFSQYGQSWMEMSDQKRRKALEREFHLDRIVLYGEVAKEKVAQGELEQSKLQDNIANKRAAVDNLNAEIARLKNASIKFEEMKIVRVENAEATLGELEQSRDSMKLIDIDNLQEKWDVIKLATERVNLGREEVQKLKTEKKTIQYNMHEAEVNLRHAKAEIEKWKKKEGKICASCEQPVPSGHIASKIKDPTLKLSDINEQINNAKDSVSKLDLKIGDKEKKTTKFLDIIESKKPNTTIQQAKTNNSEYDRRCRNIDRQKEQIKQINLETNSYVESVVDLGGNIEVYENEIKTLSKQIKKFDTLLKHIQYVYRAYSDRRKIKSYILQEYIPYLNERIAYYLDRFGLDLKLEFTDALGIKNNMWGYNFCSGGERKRMDVAIMLALFDLHTIMYGRQCNVVAFDEAERSLDPNGVNTLIEIIKEDIADKVDAVLIISHCNTMHGTFQSEIKIVREDRFSKISEIND